MASPLAFVLGTVAAIVGALVWGGIAAGTGYEIGWIALFLGAAVGFAVKVGGGKGQGAAAAAAGLTVAAICVGKLLAISWTMDSQLEQAFGAQFSREMHAEIARDATDLVALASPDQLPAYLASHGYSASSAPEGVTEDEVAEFRASSEADLRAFAADPPDFEAWKKERMTTLRRLIDQEVGVWDRLQASLSAIDIVFFLLGISTAFQLVAKGDQHD